MAFDLTDRFKQSLRGWKTRLQQSGANSAYAMVTASALWPVAATAQAGDWSGLVALGAALGGSVGGNLIANHSKSGKTKLMEPVKLPPCLRTIRSANTWILCCNGWMVLPLPVTRFPTLTNSGSSRRCVKNSPASEI
jgi:hypothetical protein